MSDTSGAATASASASAPSTTRIASEAPRLLLLDSTPTVLASPPAKSHRAIPGAHLLGSGASARSRAAFRSSEATPVNRHRFPASSSHPRRHAYSHHWHTISWVITSRPNSRVAILWSSPGSSVPASRISSAKKASRLRRRVRMSRSETSGIGRVGDGGGILRQSAEIDASLIHRSVPTRADISDGLR